MAEENNEAVAVEAESTAEIEMELEILPPGQVYVGYAHDHSF